MKNYDRLNTEAVLSSTWLSQMEPPSSSSGSHSATNHFDVDSCEESQVDSGDSDDDKHDPVALSATGSYQDRVFADGFGNAYNHLDFDNKRYTSKLKLKGTRLVYFTSAFVSLFVSLFGYEQGVCSGILTFVTFQSYFNHPNPTQIGLVISILEIGAMVSSLLVAKISDTFGRKRTVLFGTVVFMVGGCFQSFAPNLFIFGVGRVLSGLGVGILSTIVPSYQCEISPSEERGKLVCGEFTGNIIGYALSVWVDYFCFFIQDIDDARSNPHSFWANVSWRLPLFIQVLIAFILFLGGFFLVESPRWLLDVDMDQQGFHVLALLYDSDPDTEKPVSEFFMIKNSIISERKTTPKSERSWRHMLKNYTTRVFIGCSALAFAQFNGINIISYYAPLVFREAGFDSAGALLMTGINSIVYLFSTIPPWFLVDRWGRKPILISGGITMGVCLSMISLMMLLNRSYTPTMVALLVVVYNAGFGYSWGPIGYLIPPEIYPLSVRSKGVSLAVAANWFSNYVVGQMTPILQHSIEWGLYLFPALSCFVSVSVVLLYYPETKGVELEDMDAVFDAFYGNASKPGNYIPVQSNNNIEMEDFDCSDDETLPAMTRTRS
jgi:sugar porter (SP) family MFS transporter